jgi:hypothetical protein
MTENIENKEVQDQSGIAILPKTDDRPIAIVGMDGISEEVKQLSKNLTELGMEHVLLTMDDVNKEGITKEELIKAQVESSALDGLTDPLPQMTPTHTGKKNQPKKVKRKKRKKTHRKK